MHRLLLVLALLVLALVPAAAAGSATSQGYIVVLKSGTNPAAVAADQAQRLGLSVGFVYRYALNGLLGRRPGGGRSTRLRADPRVAYVERDSTVQRRHDADRRDLGPRPHRPARAAALRHVHLHVDRRRRDGLRDRHRDPQDAQRVRRPRGARRRHDDAGRESPPTTATGTARTSPARSAARPTASRRACASSPCACSTCAGTGLNSGVIAGVDWVTGQPPGRPARRREHEPRRRQVALRSSRRSRTRSPTASPTRSRPGNDTADACTGSPSGLAAAITVGATDERPTRGRATATSARASTSSRPARTSPRRPTSTDTAHRRR